MMYLLLVLLQGKTKHYTCMTDVISSKLRKPSFQLLRTVHIAAVLHGCHGKYVSWFSILNISQKSKCK